MAKNKELIDAIGQILIRADLTHEESKNALDALLAVDPANQQEFRLAVFSHLGFWEKLDKNLFVVPALSFFNRFTNSQSTVEAYAKSEAFLTENFLNIQQKAAEERIKLGFKSINDEDSLIKLLKFNEDQCRAYLATKAGFKAQGYVEADPLTPETQAKLNVLLSVELIHQIKNEAAKKMLPYLIGKCNDLDQLKNIETNKADVTQLKSLFNQLDPVNNVGNLITQELSLAAQDALSAKIKTLSDAKQKANNAKAKNDFLAKIPGLTSAELNTYQAALEADDYSALKSKEVSLKDLSDLDLAEIKAALSVPYMKLQLQTISSDDAQTILKAQNDEALKTALKNKFNFAYVDTICAKNENCNALRKSLLKVLAVACSSLFIDIKNIKSDLKNSQMPSDWLTENDLKELSELAAPKAFENDLKANSLFDPSIHSKLTAVFNGLPLEKRQHVLHEAKKSPYYFKNLLNAKDVDTLAYYFGKGAAGLQDVVIENQRVQLLKSIHNPVVAKILANFKPDIQLDAEKVKKINKAFFDGTPTPSFQTVDTSNAASYKDFVDKIKLECPGVDEAAFYKAFDLNNNGSAFLGSSSIKEEIKSEHESRKDLLKAYHANKFPEKRLYELFLRFNQADLRLNQADLATVSPEEIKSTFLKVIEGNTSEDQTFNFINLIAPDSKPPSPLRIALQKELTPSVFKQLKQEYEFSKLRQQNTDFLKRISQEVLNWKSEQLDPIQQIKQKLEPLAKIEPIHLMNPAFQSKSSSEIQEIKKKYQDLAANCELAIDELSRQKARLEDLVAHLPERNKSIELTNDVRYDVQLQYLSVLSELAFFKNVQQKLQGDQGILKTLDTVGKKDYAYIENGAVTRQTMKADAVKTAPIAPSLPNNNTKMTATPDKKDPLFKVVDKIPEGEVRVYDITSNGIVGRFTEQQVTGLPMVLKDDKVSKKNAEEFEVVQFPQLPPNLAVTHQKQLQDARVEFAMAMAAQALASMDKPPSKDNPIVLEGAKEDELKYLWTALVFLGKNTPNMKFDASAIKVQSHAFDPKSEMGRLYGLSNSSLYKTAFENCDATRKYTAGLGKVSDEKFGHEKQTKKADKGVEQVTDLFKNKLKGTKDKIEKTIEKEGPAPSSASHRPTT